MTTITQFSVVFLSSLAVFAFTGDIAAAQQKIAAAEAHVLNPLSALNPDDFHAFVDKPLFSPSRSVPDDTAVTTTVVETAPPALNIRLLGVVVTPEGATARILDVGDGKGHSLRKGDDFQDWTVVSIDRSTLKLQKDDQTLDFAVFQPVVPGARQKLPTVDNQGTDIDAEPSLSDEQRKIRIVKTWPGASDDPQTQHAKDLFDFFGPGAK